MLLINTPKKDDLIIFCSFILLVLCKFTLTTSNITGPIIYDDELIYKAMAESIFSAQPIISTHYPPLYPLLLASAFFSKTDWYKWMLLLNAVISSTIVIPLWFMAKKLLPRSLAFLSLLFAILWPFHVSYPRVILSENLYIPLFLVSILSLDAIKQNAGEIKIGWHVFFGCSMALAYLTKYIYLVAITVFLFLWLISPFFNLNDQSRQFVNRRRAFHLMAIFFGFALIFVPWLIYAHASGFSVNQGMGFDYIKSIKDYSSFESLILWTRIYLAYFALFLGPCLFFLFLYMVMLITGNADNSREENFFSLLVFLLTCVFLATAIQHSWRASYNYPYPNRIMGRYLIQLWPLYIIIFLLLLHKLIKEIHRFKWPVVVASAGLSLILQYWSRELLFSQPDWPWNFGFINSPEVASYQFEPFWVALCMGTSVMLVFLLFACLQKPIAKKLFVGFSIILLMILQITASYGAYKWSLIRNEEAIHGRRLSTILRNELTDPLNKTLILYDIPDTSKYFGFTLSSSLKFWLSLPLRNSMLSVKPLKTYLAKDHQKENVFILTDKKYNKKCFEYVVEGKVSFLGILSKWVRKRYPQLKEKKAKHYYLYDAQYIDKDYLISGKIL